MTQRPLPVTNTIMIVMMTMNDMVMTSCIHTHSIGRVQRVWAW